MIYKDPQDFIKEQKSVRQKSPAQRPRSPSPDIYRQPSQRQRRSPSPLERKSTRRSYNRSPSPIERKGSRRSQRSPSPRRHHQRSPSPVESIVPPPPPQPVFVETPTILRKPSKRRQSKTKLSQILSLTMNLFEQGATLLRPPTPWLMN